MELEYKELKKQSHKDKDKWSLANIKDGLLYFYEINNRYPSSVEIDKFEYLPSSRSIQRTFGGLVNMRKELGLERSHNYTKGAKRSKMAKEADNRARIYEKEFYDFLVSKIPEVRVHEHKIIRPGETASDFFIYTNETSGIFLDLFYAKDITSLAGIVNIKTNKCLNVNCPVYFILMGNDQISQREIDEKMLNKKILLPRHIKVITEGYFKQNFSLFVNLKAIDCF